MLVPAGLLCFHLWRRTVAAMSARLMFCVWSKCLNELRCLIPQMLSAAAAASVAAGPPAVR